MTALRILSGLMFSAFAAFDLVEFWYDLKANRKWPAIGELTVGIWMIISALVLTFGAV